MDSVGDVMTTDAEFSSSKFTLEVGERKVMLRVLKMSGGTVVFICNQTVECVEELAVAMPMSTKEVLATTIMGPHIISESQHLAEKLSRRHGRQFFVSLNVQLDRMEAPLLERQLHECIKNHVQQFV